MSYAYPAQVSYGAVAVSSNGNAAQSCAPPVRSSVHKIPHHISTIHTQPHLRTWLTEEVQYNQVPVTQEVRQVQHPTIETCSAAPACPAQAAPQPCPQQCPQPCGPCGGNRSAYGASYYGGGYAHRH